MRARFTAAIALVLAACLAIPACSGDKDKTSSKEAGANKSSKRSPGGDNPPAPPCEREGPPKPPSDALKKHLPETIDGRQVVASEKLGGQIADSDKCVEELASGELPATKDNGMGVPDAFIAVMKSTRDVAALRSSLSRGMGVIGVTEEKKISGKDVDEVTMDIGELIRQSQAGKDPNATLPNVPLPKLTIIFYTPDDDTLVFVLSPLGPEFAESVMSAAIEHAA